MDTQLVLQDNEGNTVRTFSWDKKPARVIRRSDTRRLEVRKEVESLEQRRIDFEDLGEISAEQLRMNGFSVGALGHLKLVTEVGPVAGNIQDGKENRNYKNRLDQAKTTVLNLNDTVIFTLVQEIDLLISLLNFCKELQHIQAGEEAQSSS